MCNFEENTYTIGIIRMRVVIVTELDNHRKYRFTLSDKYNTSYVAGPSNIVWGTTTKLV